MTYKIGMRVRKVRGRDQIGITGTVIGHDPDCIFGYTILIRGDGPMLRRGILESDVLGYGMEAYGNPDDWEPILDRHEPCEAEFKESLDELLSREVKNETC